MLISFRAVAAVALLACNPAGAATLQEMIDATAPGDVLDLPAGEYAGPARIYFPLTLTSSEGAHIVGDARSSVIIVEADDVTVSGLRISKSGMSLEKDQAAIYVAGDRAVIRGNVIERSLHGIYMKEAHDGLIEQNTIRGTTTRQVSVDDPLAQGLMPEADGMCTVQLDPNQRGNGIHLWNSTGNRLINNSISETRDGIYFSFSHETQVTGNHIYRVRYGLHYMYSDNNVFENNRFEQNAAGAAIMYSEGLLVRNNSFSNNGGHRAYGVLAQSVDNTTFMGNTLARNTMGLYLENSNGNTLRGNNVSRNYVGVRLSSSSAANSFSENRFQGNLHPVEVEAGVSPNNWSISGRGNSWQQARPVDLDGDGAGDLPHRQTDLLGQHRRGFPMAGFLSESPTLRLLSFIHSRTRLPGVPGIEDPAPLLRPSREKDTQPVVRILQAQ